MSKEVSRRIDFSSRTVTVDIEDIFGVISHHTIPLIADHCLYCGSKKENGSKGSPDVEASISAAILHVSEIENDVVSKLEASGFDMSAIKGKLKNG